MSSTNKSNSLVAWCICATGLVCTLLPTINAAQTSSDNAALLYYQAFLLCPSPYNPLAPAPDSIPPEAFGIVFHDAGSLDEVTHYVKDYQDAIRLAEAASKISECNWAIPLSSQGPKVRIELERRQRSLTFLIGAHARSLGANGDYAGAFAQCSTMRRFARHLFDDPGVSYPTPVAVEAVALSCTRFILDKMPPDEGTLRLLRDQLVAEPSGAESPSLSIQIKRDFERLMWAIGTEGIPSWIREKIAEKAASDKLIEAGSSLTDEQLLKLIREPYSGFVDSILEALASDMPYEQTYARVERLANELIQKAKDNPAIILHVEHQAEIMARLYSIQVRYRAHVNAVRAAVEIYLAIARTGQLPKVLPNGLPKDPYSAQDFEYEKTEEGFVLRCRAKAVGEPEAQQYEFKVRKK
jgi:hypothetical protein